MLDLLIITGASKGIGRSIYDNCKEIAKNIFAISSSDEILYLREVENPLTETIFPLQLDLQDYNNVEKVVRNNITNLNNIEKINSLGIVLCGAQIGNYGGLLDTNLDDWDKVYKINVLGNLSVVKACDNIIKSGAKTRIVFFGGGGGCFAYPEFSSYAISKVSIIRAVENLSVELLKINNDSSVIAVSPGAVDTQILKIVKEHGGSVRTETLMNEPIMFVRKFLTDEFPVKKLNGKILHVRDDIEATDFSNKDIFQLRRIQ